MAQKKDRVPVREQEPKVRVQNFQEVCYGYNVTEAQEEATRCLQCKKPRCIEACPVNIHIPQFIKKVLEGDVLGAADIIGQDSSLWRAKGIALPFLRHCTKRAEC